MTNREKILAAAQKYLQKNNLPRAIKEYNKALDLDAKDVRSRQKLAELYSRIGNTEEALSNYATVATYYAENTFYLKAIAVYKQMQKLAPENLTYTLKLAKLNEQQGLIGNALAEYRILLAAYEQSGQNDKAVDVLNSMRTLDPDNINIAMRVAGFYAEIGDSKKAHDEYSVMEDKLIALGDYPQLQKFYKHFMALWPDDVEVHVGYGRAMISCGESIGGVQYLTNLQRQYPHNPEVLFALAEGFRACGEFIHELECLVRLTQWDPESLDYQLALYLSAFDAEDVNFAFSAIEKGRPLFETADRLADLKPSYEKLHELWPDNRDVLNSLNTIYELLGEGEKLFDVLSSDFGGETPDYDETGVSPAAASDAGAFEEMHFDNAVEPSVASVDDITFDDITFDIAEDNEEGTSETFALDLEAVEQSSVVDIHADLEEADFYLQQGLLEEAQKVCRRLESVNANDAKVVLLKQQIEQRQQVSTGADEPVTKPSIAVDVDLASGNSEVVLDLDLSALDTNLDNVSPIDSFNFNDNDSDIEASISVLKFETNSQPAHTLADSQRGVSTVIKDEDTESAYNLGIAYKEMGLIDDAIAEFDKAMADPTHKVDCACLKAACYIAQQNFTAAEHVLTQALSGSLTTEQQIILYYETGLLYESWDRFADALSSYQVVADNDLQFRDVGAKIIELKELVDGENCVVPEASRVSYL